MKLNQVNLFALSIIIIYLSFSSKLSAETLGTGKGPVIAVRHLELKAGVDTTEFEKFVLEEFNPAMQGTMPGLTEFIAKSDRGKNVGSYVLFHVFDSQIVRDQLVPKGGMSDWFSKIVSEQKIWPVFNKFKEYVVEESWRTYNDYVVLR